MYKNRHLLEYFSGKKGIIFRAKNKSSLNRCINTLAQQPNIESISPYGNLDDSLLPVLKHSVREMTLVYVCVCLHYLMVTIVTPAGPGVQKQLRAYTSSISFLIASRRIPSPDAVYEICIYS